MAFAVEVGTGASMHRPGARLCEPQQLMNSRRRQHVSTRTDWPNCCRSLTRDSLAWRIVHVSVTVRGCARLEPEFFLQCYFVLFCVIYCYLVLFSVCLIFNPEQFSSTTDGHVLLH